MANQIEAKDDAEDTVEQSQLDLSSDFYLMAHDQITMPVLEKIQIRWFDTLTGKNIAADAKPDAREKGIAVRFESRKLILFEQLFVFTSLFCKSNASDVFKSRFSRESGGHRAFLCALLQTRMSVGRPRPGTGRPNDSPVCGV